MYSLTIRSKLHEILGGSSGYEQLLRRSTKERRKSTHRLALNIKSLFFFSVAEHRIPEAGKPPPRDHDWKRHREIIEKLAKPKVVHKPRHVIEHFLTIISNDRLQIDISRREAGYSKFMPKHRDRSWINVIPVK